MKKKIIIAFVLLLCLLVGICSLAACNDGEEQKGTPVDSRTLTLDKTAVELALGDGAVKLTPALSEGKGYFTWESSDKSVVTVDEHGNVTAVATGMATVTVKCGTLAPASCEITVKMPPYVPVFAADAMGVGIERSIQKGSTLKIDGTVKYNGEAVESEVTYTSADSSIATVSADGVISGVKGGTVEIQAVTVYFGMEVHMTVTVTVIE